VLEAQREKGGGTDGSFGPSPSWLLAKLHREVTHRLQQEAKTRGIRGVARRIAQVLSRHQLGLIAATAYVMSAIALAVGNNGRKFAAFFLGCLALGAIVANWSETLDALAYRGAGKEAEAAKLSPSRDRASTGARLSEAASCLRPRSQR